MTPRWTRDQKARFNRRLPTFQRPDMTREEKIRIRDEALARADDPKWVPAVQEEFRQMAARLTAELEAE